MSFSFRNLLCAVDFSPTSIAALDLSLALAGKYGAREHVVHAYTIPVVPFVENGIVVADEPRLAAALDVDLHNLVAARPAASAAVEYRVAEGPPADVVLLEAGRVAADLIVLGTRGLSGLPRFLLGSVAERVVRMSPVSVLVVPEPSGDEPRQIRKVLCGLDFSEPASDALRAAAALAERHQAALHLLHVWDPPAFLASHPELTEAQQRNLERDLEGEARRAVPSGVAFSCAVRRGVPYVTLVDEARALQADLIVIGSTGKSGLLHFLLGGVAERVLRASHVPVLVVRNDSGSRVA